MEIVKQIIAFRNSTTTKRLKSYQETPSLMEIYGINRREIRHTSLLKWIFSEKNPVGKNALELFIDVLFESKFFKIECTNIKPEIYNKILLGNYKIDSFSSSENFSVSNGLVDLVIEFSIEDISFNIIIENKVYSEEHNEQTIRYYNHFNNKFREKVNLFVFLSPLSSKEYESLEVPQCECKEYIQINYQIILEKVVIPLLNLDIDSTTKYILEDYIMALSTPVNSNYKQNNYIMAISPKESELLNMFWKENKELILKAVEATKNNLHLEPEEREFAQKIDSVVKSTENKGIGAFVKQTLKNLAFEGKLSNEVDKLLDKQLSKSIFNINYPLLIKTEGSSPLHYWKDIITINDENFYMCCEWFESSRVLFEIWKKQVE